MRTTAAATLACAVALAAGPGRADPPAPPADSGAPALEEAVRRTPVRDLGALVAADPRFAALDAGARFRLLEAVRPSPLLRAAASALNFWPSFGVGSLLLGDLTGAAVQAGGEVLGGLLLLAAGELQDGGAIGPASALLVLAGVGAIAASLGYGIVRPWGYEGRRHAALRERLFPPARPPVRPEPVAAAPPPRAEAGVVVLSLRF